MSRKLFTRERESLFTQEQYEKIDRAYKSYKKLKLKKMYKRLLLLDGEYERMIKDFMFSMDTKDKGIFSVELDYIEKLIKMFKLAYENGMDNIIPDSLYDPMLVRFKVFRVEPIEGKLPTRAEAVAEHKYPKLKGTLDKAHYILADKKEYYIDSVEKFIDEIFKEAKGDIVKILLSLKYDGTSCVFSIRDDGSIESSITRGKDSRGVEITHLFKHLKFDNPFQEQIGLQTEVMMTNEDIKEYSKEKGYDYSNSRTAVTSILTALDGHKYSKYLSPVPLAMVNNDGEFLSYKNLNVFKHKIPFICKEVVTSDKEQAMDMIKEYILNILLARNNFEFQIDGIVIDCMNTNIRKSLGRTGQINNFQVAYKFPSLAQETKVRGVTYSVGRTGLVIPKVHYDPVFFNGTEQTKTTLSSRKRLEKLELSIGDIGLVEYSNDVIPYFSKVVRHMGGEPIFFPKVCPVCQNMLIEDGANSFCINPKCPPKMINKFTNFIKVLGVRDLSEKFIERLLDHGLFHDFRTFLKPEYHLLQYIDGVGDIMIGKFKDAIDKILTEPLSEEKFAEALGLSGGKTCKAVLCEIHLAELLQDPDKLYYIQVPGIEKKKKEKFLEKLNEVNTDNEILELLDTLNIVPCKKDHYDMRVCFTGFRDGELKEKLQSMNIAVVDTLKDITFLVVPDYSCKSNKVKTATKRDIEVIDITDFKDRMGL